MSWAKPTLVLITGTPDAKLSNTEYGPPSRFELIMVTSVKLYSSANCFFSEQYL